MTTATRAPQVWRGYDALARSDEPVGSHYSPKALAALRLLVDRPGLTAAEVGLAIGRKACRAAHTLDRLHGLELTSRTGDRWELTGHGRELVVLIDREGIT